VENENGNMITLSIFLKLRNSLKKNSSEQMNNNKRFIYKKTENTIFGTLVPLV
jgi:hypothetical protein